MRYVGYKIANQLNLMVRGNLLGNNWCNFKGNCEGTTVAIELFSGELIGKTLEIFRLEEPCQMLRYENASIYLVDGWKRAYIIPDLMKVYEANDFLLSKVFCYHAVRRQMIQLHCATIDDDGRGILFLGPSGIGKTTQAERWAQYRGSAIINGDIGFVQRTPAGYTAWGTPWHGSSPYCLNASVPVKALVVLKQAPQNALRELTGFEKVREVSGSVFYPTWLEDGMELCTDTLNHLLSDLPVYRLDNRADEEAVRLLAAEIDRIS